jgi:hypothetical protein
MSEQRLQTFAEFWPFYVGEHRLPSCRAVHYVGSFAAPATLLWVIATASWAFLPLVLVAGYGPAWVGHFVIEKNRPATFTYPVWSLLGDYKMLGLALRGKMADEVSRLYGSASPSKDAPLLADAG